MANKKIEEMPEEDKTLGEMKPADESTEKDENSSSEES